MFLPYKPPFFSLKILSILQDQFQYHLLLDGFQREIIASTYIITLSENEIVNKDHILLIYALPTEDKKVFGKLNSKSILFKKSLQIGKQMN